MAASVAADDFGADVATVEVVLTNLVAGTLGLFAAAERQVERRERLIVQFSAGLIQDAYQNERRRGLLLRRVGLHFEEGHRNLFRMIWCVN
ncbi:hypothetical protein [Pseudomonas phage Epa15]|uniref:Uncharacterized protein n=1 Tax=Pseudomonas phage Epa15 TaxID=2733395 RepID=A0A7T0M775_9CAUD|nr:hypothetical protein [Pseudomonas phage Epa15]